MKKILVVEDDPKTLDQLVSLLEDMFHDADVDAVDNVTTGHALIDATDERCPYDAAILDFKVPLHSGGNACVNDQLCLLIQSKCAPTIVAHITSNLEDPVIEEHMLRCHQMRSGPRGFSISKSIADYPEQLVLKLRQTFLDIEMGQLLADMGRDAASDPLYQRVGSVRGQGVTYRFMRWAEQVVTHWDSFDTIFKDRVRLHFIVSSSENGVGINLR